MIKNLILMVGAVLALPCWAVIGGEAAVSFPEVVRLEAGPRVCTGTIIGPRAVLSAAHCATEQSYFVHQGKKYPVRFVASREQEKGHDVALAITEEKIAGARFARMGQGIQHGTKILLAGFGCTEKGGKPGALHVGQNQVIGLDDDHVLAASRDGSVLCQGDSGGPAFVTDGVKRLLVAVSSLSDLKKININVRLDSRLSHGFLKATAQLHKLEICGLTSEC